MSTPVINVYPSFESMSRAAAALFVQESKKAITANGRFSVCLSGGGTPKRTYEYLAQTPFRDQIVWSKIHVFWGDERCVPASDGRSNQRMTRDAWLDHVPIPADHIHAVRGELDPKEGALDYEEVLKSYFGDADPGFDLALLGLGENGHTASLWPNNKVLQERKRWAIEVYVPEQDLWRVTLTAPVLNKAAVVAFLVSGEGKAGVLRDVVEGPPNSNDLPAQLIIPSSGKLFWYIDRDAASRLRSSNFIALQ